MAQANFKVVQRANQNQALVRPPFDTATKGNPTGVKIQNKTQGVIWVFLPAGVFAETAAAAPDPVAMYIVAKGASKDFKVHANATEGAFSFTIFCEATFSCAQGNSDPEFIIEN